jgi:catechol 2,3-dioxygenase-like lactoylglutathione lyase family enzyme
MSKPILNQINLVCGDLDASIAFYRRLGVEIPDARVWRTRTGAHHANTVGRSADPAMDFDLDSAAFAQHWNAGWKGQTDLRGRVVVGFRVPTREDVDAIFGDMTSAGYRGLQPAIVAYKSPGTPFGARVTRLSRTRRGLRWA